MSLRVVFMGTPDFSVPALESIRAAGHDVVVAYSQPPRRAGRGMKERKSPVHLAAERAGIPVLTPDSLKSEAASSRFEAHSCDVAVVVAYGLILPKAILDIPAHGCLNIHASLLPRWRGAAPINRAVMEGDSTTGVTIMKMEEGLDTGPIANGESGPLVQTLAIGRDETAGDLHDRLASAGADLICRALDGLEDRTIAYRDQPEAGVTYARKIDKSETRIAWDRPAAEVHNHIRGLSPFPGAWCLMPFGDALERVKILGCQRLDDAIAASRPAGEVVDDDLAIACGTGALRPTLLQRAGKQALARETFLRGHAIKVGVRLR